MQVHTIPLGPLQANCLVLYEEPDNALVIDPGAEPDRLLSELNERGIQVHTAAITHGHFDHTGAVDELVRQHGAVFAMHPADREIIDMTPPGTEIWGHTVASVPQAGRALKHSETLTVGGLEVRAIHTPGHTPGSTCYFVERAGILATGDTLFERSIGRSDFPGGDARTLVDSIRQRLFVLPAATQVIPGHGASTTIGDEMRENPFVAVPSPTS